MLIESVTSWFKAHAMNPMFQLSELQKETGLTYTVRGKEVEFNKNKSSHALALTLDGKVLELGTWKYLRDVDLEENVVVVEENSKELDHDEQNETVL